MRKLFSFVSFPFLATLSSYGQDEPASPPSLVQEKAVSIGRGMPEEFFPELRNVLSHLEENSPALQVERERENEALARKIVIDGRRGWRGGLRMDTYSLHENRASGNFRHRYRFLASANGRRYQDTGTVSGYDLSGLMGLMESPKIRATTIPATASAGSVSTP